MDSAAALSDSVMAAVIASVTVGGLPSRSAAMINGTLIVDQAGPLFQLPKVIGACPLPTGLTAPPTAACSRVSNWAKSAASVTAAVGGAVLWAPGGYPTPPPAASTAAASTAMPVISRIG